MTVPGYIRASGSLRMKRHAFSCLAAFVFAAILLTGQHAHAQTASQCYAQAVQAYNQGDIDGAKRQLALALEIDKNFRPATALLQRIAQAQSASAGPTPAAVVPVKSLERMVVPVEFKDTSLQSALEYIRQHIESASGGKTAVNFVLNVPPELANKRISLQMDHVPVTELLRYVGDLAGVSFQFQKYAILVTPASATAAPSGTP